MGDISRSSANIYVQGIPDNWSREQKIAFLDRMESQLGGNSFNGSLAQAQSLFPGRASDAAALQERQQLGAIGGLASSALVQSETQREAQEAVGDETRRSDPSRVLGGINRELGPYAAGAATGAALGATVGGVGAAPGALAGVAATGISKLVTPIVTEALNAASGKNVFASAEEAEDFVFNALNQPKPQTQQEMFARDLARAVGDTMSMYGLGQTVTQGMNLAQQVAPGARTQAQNFMNLMSQAPGEQIAGAVAGEAGAQVGENIAESTNAGPVASAVLGTAGGMAGDLLGSSLYDVNSIVNQAAGKRQATQLAPTGSRSPYTRSELSPPTTQAGVARQNVMEGTAGGTGEFQFRRFNENQRELAQVMDEFGVPVDELGNTPDFSRELMDDFISTRRGRLSENVDAKRDVIARLSQDGGTIPTERGSSLLDDLIARETELATTGSEQRAAMWANLKGDIENKTFDQLEMVRQDYSQMFRNQDMPDRMQQDLRNVYREIFGSYGEDGQRIAGDIDAFIEANGTEADLNQFLSSNRNLYQMANDFQDRALTQVLSEWDKNPENISPQVITQLLFSRDPSDVEKLYRNLSEDGRATARQALLGKFAETQQTNDMSPSLFAQNLRDYGEQVGVYFSDDEAQYLAGLKQHFDMTRRAEEFTRGSRGYQGLPTSTIPGAGTLVSMGVRGNPVVGAATSIATLGGLGRVARIYEQTPQIKRMLMELADLSPGSVEAQNLSRLITRAAVREAEQSEEGAREQSTNRQTR